MNVTGTFEGASIKNSGFLGSTYESKEINYTHITPAVFSAEDPQWSNTVLLLNGEATDKSTQENNPTGQSISADGG